MRLTHCDIGYHLRAMDYFCVSICAFVLVKLTYCDIGYDLRAMDYFEQSLVICEDNADLYGQVLLCMCARLEMTTALYVCSPREEDDADLHGQVLLCMCARTTI